MKYFVKLVASISAPATAFIFALVNPSAGRSAIEKEYLSFAVMYEFSRSATSAPFVLMHTVVNPGLSTGVFAAYDAAVL